MNQELIDRIRGDPGVVSVEMVPDENRGTIWSIHLRNGGTLWSGGGVFDIVARDGARCTVRRRARRPHNIPDVPDIVMVEEIEPWLRWRHPEIDEWVVGENSILYGRVQSGKTALILSMIWITQHVHNTPCILVLANMVQSYHHVLGKNATEFNEGLLETFGDRARPFFLKTTGFRGGAVAAEDVDPTWLRVAMSDPAQIRRLLTAVPGRFMLFSDEADVHVKACDEETDTTSTGPLMRRLQEMASGSVKISATPFAMWNEKHAVQKTIRMRVPPNYRGLSEAEWDICSEADAQAVRRGNAPTTVRLLDTMVRRLRPRVEHDRRRRYLSILINAPPTIRGQNRLVTIVGASKK